MDILDRIDRAVGCQQCGGLLETSPSDDFCSEGCSKAWYAAHADRVPYSTDALLVTVTSNVRRWNRTLPADEVEQELADYPRRWVGLDPAIPNAQPVTIHVFDGERWQVIGTVGS